MTVDQLAYIERRRRQIRYWPYVAALLFALLAACYVFLYIRYPIYVSPVALVDMLQAQKPDLQKLAVLAALGNLAFIGCGLFIAALIAVASLALYNEHRLIRLLDQHLQVNAATPVLPDASSGGEEPPSAGLSG